MGVGRNLAYRKELFYRHKGFSAHNKIPGGDDDLFINAAATRHNTAIVTDPESFTYSNPKKTWGEWFRQKKRHFSTGRFYKPLHKFLLGLYAFSQLCIYPAAILTAIFYDWRLAAAIFALRLISLSIVWFLVLNKLREKDLKPWLFIFDIWMVFYLLIFTPATWKKIKPGWS
ncbi:MAG: glycosyl transferase family 2, partial [Dinghuibacter sp.]|nr:glycosyl transferase family 2 [Dinghuibacter sp.]